MSSTRIFSSTFLRVSGALVAFACAGTYLVVPVESASAAVPIAQYVSTQKTYDGVPNNYAINLVEGSSAANVQAAARISQEQGGVVLTQYPQFASFTVQAAKAGYSQKLAQALASAGIRVHSIAPTHGTAVEDSEIVVPNAKKGNYIPLDDAITAVGPGPGTGVGLQTVKAVDAYNVDVPLEPVSVAVIDTGIAGLHSKLRGKIDYSRSVNCARNGKPFALKEGNNDTIGHGTHVAGIIVSEQRDEGWGGPFGGVAPKNTTLVDIKVFNKEDSTFAEDLACAYTWAAEHDTDITNASLGGFWNPNNAEDAAQAELMRRSIAYASQKGVAHVAAAMNNNLNLDSPTTFDYWDKREQVWKCNVNIRNNKVYPGMLPDVINVSSTNWMYPAETIHAIYGRYSAEETGCGHEVVSGSNWGKNSIDVAAPGDQIYSTFPRIPSGGYSEAYSYMGGTSMAAPHAAGVLALLKGIHPDYTPQQLRALLYKHAERTPLKAPSDRKEYRGHGLVNALLAVTKDQPKPTVTVEYSADGGKTWKKLQGATVNGKIDVRVRATGPVTRL
ncbi:MAG: S8 family serine peptidase, partial [Actinomycetaceae bacterium]|nr:S8 family serine peptidase [Actinomycetaceae bacterium]